MKVQYDVTSGGQLKIAEIADDERMLVLDPSYWQLSRCSPNQYGSESRSPPFTKRINVNAPTVEIPDELFHDLWHGIRRYFKQLSEEESSIHESPHITNLRNCLITREAELIAILEENDEEGFEIYHRLRSMPKI